MDIVISWRKNLLWIWLSLFLAMAGFSVAYPVIPFYLVDHYKINNPPVRDLYISLFTFAGNLGFLLFSPIWGRMADSFGRRSMMTRANACSAALLPLIALMPSPDWQVVLRFFIGAFAGVVSAAMTLVACTTPERHRGMAMGAVSSAIFCGNLAGTVLGGFCAGTLGYNFTFASCGVCMLVAALISHFLIREDPCTLNSNRDFRSFLPKMTIPQLGPLWYLLICTMWMGLIQCMDGPFVPMLVDMVIRADSATAMRWNGLLGGMCAAAGIAGGFIIGSLADRYPGHKVGIIITALGALFLLPQAICHSLGWLFVERIIMTFFVSGLSPVMQSWLSLTTDPARRGVFFGYATSCRATGWLIGGAIGMFVTYYFGTRMIFTAGALAMAAMAFMIWFTQTKLPFPHRR